MTNHGVGHKVFTVLHSHYFEVCHINFDDLNELCTFSNKSAVAIT